MFFKLSIIGGNVALGTCVRRLHFNQLYGALFVTCYTLRVGDDKPERRGGECVPLSYKAHALTIKSYIRTYVA